MLRLLLLSTVFLALVACDKEDDDTGEQVIEIRYENVDEELQSYFTAYEAEAAARGIEVDLSAMNLTARIHPLAGNGVAGECRFDPDNPNEVSIDEDTWDQVGPTLKEYIVFHELGHCERLRGHREAADSTGQCLSIMASGTGDCREAYSRSTRDRHLDELFDEQYYGTWP